MPGMATHQALILEAKGLPLVQHTLPIPDAVIGSAVVKVLAAAISPNTKDVLAGNYPVPLLTPVTPSAPFIGRVHAVGKDATALRPGDLVMSDFLVQGRDDPETNMLMGYMTLEGQDEFERTWGHGSFAEYARVPLERCWKINEDIVTKLGYRPRDLAYIPAVAIPLAGLLDVGVKHGDTVVIAPATGHFGGSAVVAALSLGANVVACGRNRAVLNRMERVYKGRVIGVEMTGDEDKDTSAISKACYGGSADVYVDFMPPAAAGVKYLACGIKALRPCGAAVILGLTFSNVELPYAKVMKDRIRIQGRYMFDGTHAKTLIRLVEQGCLRVGSGPGSEIAIKTYSLDEVLQGMETAKAESGWGRIAVLEPARE